MPTVPPDPTYRLVIFHAPDDPRAVRELLCAVTGDHPTDAAQWVARAPGIWARPLAEGEVRELLDGLYKLGVAAEARRIDTLPNLSPPRTIHEAACLPEGLRITGLRGEPIHWIPWDKVELIHVGQIEQDDEAREADWSSNLMDGLRALSHRPGRIGPRTGRTVKEPRPPVGEAQVVRGEPRLAFRIAENSMNYGYLKGRLQPTAAANFRLLVNDLVELAADAYLTPATDDFLDGKPRLFESPQEMLGDTTLQLLWSWYRRDRDRQGPTEPGND
ncbi:MAG: hypothetical protein U0800_13000 [Isosphaeraceae bacterium]